MKKVVITGATGGVGLALTYHFANEGWEIVGLSRDYNALSSLSKSLGNFTGYPCDIKDFNWVNKTFESIGHIDCLINNAAIFRQGPLTGYDLDDIQDIIGTNLLGTIFVTQRALYSLQDDSRIINISSVAATHGIENQSLYCASKYGLDGFMESLSLELRDRGIQITTIYPGGINTPLWNADNPYPGDVNDLLVPDDVVKEVAAVVNLRAGVVKKKVVLYPSNEIH